MPSPYDLPIPDVTLPEQIQEINVINWNVGEVTEFQRAERDGLTSTKNVILRQDGMVGQRPSLIKFRDGQLPGNMCGKPLQFSYNNKNYLIAAFDKSGTKSIQTLNLTDKNQKWTSIALDDWTFMSNECVSFSEVKKTIVITGGSKLGFVDLTEPSWRIYVPPDFSKYIEAHKEGKTSRVGANTDRFALQVELKYPLLRPFGTSTFQDGGVVTYTDVNSVIPNIIITYPNFQQAAGAKLTFFATLSSPYGESTIVSDVHSSDALPPLGFKTLTGRGTYATSISDPSAREAGYEVRRTFTNLRLMVKRVTLSDIFGTEQLKRKDKITYNFYVGANNNAAVFLGSVTDDGTTPSPFTDDYLPANKGLNVIYFDWKFDDTVDYTKIIPASYDQPPDTRYSVSAAGRVFLYGDRDEPGRITYSGYGENALRFTRDLDSGSLELGLGNNETIEHIEPFKNTQATSGLLVYTSQAGFGFGKEYFLQPVTINTAAGITNVFQVNQTGVIGTNSPFGVVEYLDNVYRLTRDGFKVFGVKPDLQNLVVNDSISQTIQKSVEDLDYRTLDKVVSAVWRQRVVWAIPERGQSTPNKLWLLDLRHSQGAWMLGWDVSADWLLTINDNEGRENLLIFKDDKMFQLTEESGSEVLNWSFTTGKIFNPNSHVYQMASIEAFFVLYDLVGIINISIFGRTANFYDELLASKNVGSNSQSAEGGTPWGVHTFGSVQWGEGIHQIQIEGNEPPISYVQIKLNKLVRWWYFKVEAVSPFAQVKLARAVFRFVQAGPLVRSDSQVT